MMMKKFVVLLAFVGLVFQISGCTAKNSKDDSAVASEFDSSDLEKVEGAEAKEAAATDKSLSSDQLPEDALGETKPTDTAAADGKAAMPSDPFAASATDGSAATPPADASTTVVDANTQTPPAADMAGTTPTESAPVSTEAPVAKVSSPLQKVAAAPWKAGKTWVNTVYFARPGDTVQSISQMIYGSDNSKQLKKINTALKSREVKPGEKVYYNSPRRADDSARMITYYEDNGINPEVYVSQAGDNLKKVSKKLLGYSNAWKEVWATNAVESKGSLPEGTSLSYWKGSVAPVPVPTQDLAGAPAAGPAAGTAQAQAPAPPADLPGAPNANVPPPPPPPAGGAQAAAEIPPPPPMPEAQNAPPPPPPPDMNQAPPPPPPPVEAVNPPAPKAPHANIERDTAGTGMDNDTTLALAVVGLAAAGLAILIVMRKKKKQKDLEQQAMSETHVGT